MKLGIEAIKTILDIQGDVCMSEKDMAKKLKVTFFSKIEEDTSENVRAFSKKLKKTLAELGVEIIPYEQTLEPIRLKRRIKMILMMLGMNIKNMLKGKFEFFAFDFGKKVKKGIAIIQTGEGETGDLPVDHVLSLRENPMILITDQPDEITEKSAFKEHLEASLPIFSWNITNLIVSVSKTHWTVYSFNMSYPMHRIDGDFNKDILHALVPKIYAPVIPPRISDFEIHNSAFDTDDEQYKPYIKDLIESGPILEQTKLYPEPKKISEFKFRSAFYRWLGSLLLDKRSGMSYGFIARQLPMKFSEIREAGKQNNKKDYFFKGKDLYIKFDFNNNKYEMKVPDVWVLTSRSGSDKTKLNPKTDIVRMGLVNGKMIMETPKGVSVGPDYKPSFDTKVILAHSVANAIFASIAKHINPDSEFADKFASNGRALAHWHGYFDPKKLPKSWHYYGENNPPVSCSAPQGAVYAFKGKEELFTCIIQRHLPYEADIHMEPQHGSNVSFSSLKNLGNFLIKNKNTTKLGNEYLALYS
ncbi:MAG: hypothetical protein COY02_03080 [Parcubacteria group bacterium CG_4_10_14_0_2_um_filter_41_6]|nr:MAG: hypothetical protein COY02_03080 [Parcubacteria group bacterium CG_4_10_14_0_2_um_filter_41_6]